MYLYARGEQTAGSVEDRIEKSENRSSKIFEIVAYRIYTINRTDLIQSNKFLLVWFD